MSWRPMAAKPGTGPAGSTTRQPGSTTARASGGVPYQGPTSEQFILRFGKDSPLSTREQNDRCLQCHEKGKRMFWQGYRPHLLRNSDYFTRISELILLSELASDIVYRYRED